MIGLYTDPLQVWCGALHPMVDVMIQIAAEEQQAQQSGSASPGNSLEGICIYAGCLPTWESA